MSRIGDTLKRHEVSILITAHITSFALLARTISNEPSLSSLQGFIIATIAIISLSGISKLVTTASADGFDEVAFKFASETARTITTPGVRSRVVAFASVVLSAAMWLFSYSVDVPCGTAKVLRWQSALPLTARRASCDGSSATVHGVGGPNVRIERLNERSEPIDTCTVRSWSASQDCDSIGSVTLSLSAYGEDIKGALNSRTEHPNYTVNFTSVPYQESRAWDVCTNASSDVAMVDEPWLSECSQVLKPISIREIGYSSWAEFVEAFGPRMANLVAVRHGNDAITSVFAVPLLRNVMTLWANRDSVAQLPASLRGQEGTPISALLRHPGVVVGTRSDSPSNVAESIIQVATSDTSTDAALPAQLRSGWAMPWLSRNQGTIESSLALMPGSHLYPSQTAAMFRCANDACDAANLTDWLRTGRVRFALGWANWTAAGSYLANGRGTFVALPIYHPLSGSWFLGVTRRGARQDRRPNSVALVTHMISRQFQAELVRHWILPSLAASIQNARIGEISILRWVEVSESASRPGVDWNSAETNLNTWSVSHAANARDQ